MGRLTLNVLLSFAQFEREIAGERIRDKIKASRKKGMWMGGSVPLGYEVKNRALVVNETEAKKVRLIFRRYVQLGSVDALADELDRKSIRSHRRVTQDGRTIGGRPLTRGNLYQILQNPIYLGAPGLGPRSGAARQEPGGSPKADACPSAEPPDGARIR